MVYYYPAISLSIFTTKQVPWVFRTSLIKIPEWPLKKCTDGYRKNYFALAAQIFYAAR